MVQCYAKFGSHEFVGLSQRECRLWSKASWKFYQLLLTSWSTDPLFCGGLVDASISQTSGLSYLVCVGTSSVWNKKKLPLGHAWLEDGDYVGLKYMSNFDQSHCYNHFNMSFTRPSVGCARLAKKFVNQSNSDHLFMSNEKSFTLPYLWCHSVIDLWPLWNILCRKVLVDLDLHISLGFFFLFFFWMSKIKVRWVM